MPRNRAFWQAGRDRTAARQGMPGFVRARHETAVSYEWAATRADLKPPFSRRRRFGVGAGDRRRRVSDPLTEARLNLRRPPRCDSVLPGVLCLQSIVQGIVAIAYKVPAGGCSPVLAVLAVLVEGRRKM